MDRDGCDNPIGGASVHMSPTWETTADWDAGQSETGVHHEQPTGVDWSASDVLEKGYPSTDEGGSSLRAYWPLDEDSGTTANDVSGNGNDGNYNGPTLGVTSVFDSTCPSFDGTDDAVDSIGDPFTGTYDPVNTGRTVLCWVKLSTDDDAAATGWGGGGEFEFIGVNLSGDSLLKLGSNGQTPGSGSTLSPGTWYQIGYRWNASAGDYDVFLDGSVDYTVTPTGTSWMNNLTSWIHGDCSFSGLKEWAGEVDEIRVYERELSNQEVLDYYEAPL